MNNNVFVLSEQSSIANHFLSELRDVTLQNDRMRFRRNMERLGEILLHLGRLDHVGIKDIAAILPPCGEMEFKVERGQLPPFILKTAGLLDHAMKFARAALCR